MRHKLPRILLLSAWLVATGGLWILVQVVAWTRMFSTEVATMSVIEAAENTFSADNKCQMCLIVERGKRTTQDETGGAVSSLVGKAPVVFQSVTRIFVSPPDAMLALRPESGIAAYRRDVPPVPPPRLAV